MTSNFLMLAEQPVKTLRNDLQAWPICDMAGASRGIRGRPREGLGKLGFEDGGLLLPRCEHPTRRSSMVSGWTQKCQGV